MSSRSSSWARRRPGGNEQRDESDFEAHQNVKSKPTATGALRNSGQYQYQSTSSSTKQLQVLTNISSDGSCASDEQLIPVGGILPISRGGDNDSRHRSSDAEEEEEEQRTSDSAVLTHASHAVSDIDSILEKAKRQAREIAAREKINVEFGTYDDTPTFRKSSGAARTSTSYSTTSTSFIPKSGSSSGNVARTTQTLYQDDEVVGGILKKPSSSLHKKTSAFVSVASRSAVPSTVDTTTPVAQVPASASQSPSLSVTLGKVMSPLSLTPTLGGFFSSFHKPARTPTGGDAATATGNTPAQTMASAAGRSINDESRDDEDDVFSSRQRRPRNASADDKEADGYLEEVGDDGTIEVVPTSVTRHSPYGATTNAPPRTLEHTMKEFQQVNRQLVSRDEMLDKEQKDTEQRLKELQQQLQAAGAREELWRTKLVNGEGEDGETKAEEGEKKTKARDLGKLSQSSGLSKLKRGREIPRRGGS